MSRRAVIVLIVVAVVIGAVVVAVVATRGGGDDSQEAQQNLCDSISALETSLTGLASLSLQGSSSSDFQDAFAEIQGTWDDVKSAAGDVKDVNADALQSSWDNFKAAVEGVPDNASVSEALSSVASAGTALAGTLQSTLQGLTCNSSG